MFFSSVALAYGMPFPATIAPSKGAVEALCRSLLAEYTSNVRFNCIALNLTDTRLIEMDAKQSVAWQKHPTNSIKNLDDVTQMAYFLARKRKIHYRPSDSHGQCTYPSAQMKPYLS